MIYICYIWSGTHIKKIRYLHNNLLLQEVHRILACLVGDEPYLHSKPPIFE